MTEAIVHVGSTKESVIDQLNQTIVKACQLALSSTSSSSSTSPTTSSSTDPQQQQKSSSSSSPRFVLALSGGSLPSLLTTLPEAFQKANVDPQFHYWYIVLADERCVPISHPDSNLGTLLQQSSSFLSQIPLTQIYGINTTNLQEEGEGQGGGGINSNNIEEETMKIIDQIAQEYEMNLRQLMMKRSTTTTPSDFLIDLAILGFGPDGHTCSLFPNHVLLQETSKWVAPIIDSPKPPLCRITITFPIWNTRTKQIVFCGLGDSKAPILQQIYTSVQPIVGIMKNDDDDNNNNTTTPSETTKTTTATATEELNSSSIRQYKVTYKHPPPFPCAMVVPIGIPSGMSTSSSSPSLLSWIVDDEAFQGVVID